MTEMKTSMLVLQALLAASGPNRLALLNELTGGYHQPQDLFPEALKGIIAKIVEIGANGQALNVGLLAAGLDGDERTKIMAINELSPFTDDLAACIEIGRIYREEYIAWAAARLGQELVGKIGRAKNPEEIQAAQVGYNQAMDALFAIGHSNMLSTEDLITLVEHGPTINQVPQSFFERGILYRGEISVLIGSPGVGKSMLLLSLALNVLRNEKTNHVVLVSLEMPKEQFMVRLAAALGGFNSVDYSNQTANPERIKQGFDELRRLAPKLTLLGNDDLNPATSDNLLHRLKRIMQAKGNIDFVGIDYSLYMSPNKGRVGSKLDHFEVLFPEVKLAASTLRNNDGSQAAWLIVHPRNRLEESSLKSMAYGGDFDASVVILINDKDILEQPKRYSGMLAYPKQVLIVKHRHDKKDSFDDPPRILYYQGIYSRWLPASLFQAQGEDNGQQSF